MWETVWDFIKHLFNISTLGTVIGTSVVLASSYLASNSTNKKMLASMSWWVAFGGVIILLSSQWSGFQQSQTESELMKVTKENAELSGRIKNLVTGGDSYCYVFISPWMEGNTINGTIYHRGDFPLYDVEMTITDMSAYKSLVESGEFSLDGIDACKESIKLGNFTSAKDINLPPIKVSQPDDQEYKIKFIARNGSWTQFIRLHRDPIVVPHRVVNGKEIPAPDITLWHQAFMVTGRGDTLETVIGSLFPRNDSGKVDF